MCNESYGEKHEYVVVNGRRHRVIHPKRKVTHRRVRVHGGAQRIALTTARGNKHLRHSINYITRM